MVADNIIVVLKYASHDEITEELTSFGLSKEVPGSDNDSSPFYRWGFLQTLDKVDEKTRENYTTASVPVELVDAIMSLNPISFELIWRSDLLVEREVELFDFIHHPDVVDNETGEIITPGYREKVSLGFHLITTTEEWPFYSVEDIDPDTGAKLETYHQVPVGGIG